MMQSSFHDLMLHAMWSHLASDYSAQQQTCLNQQSCTVLVEASMHSWLSPSGPDAACTHPAGLSCACVWPGRTCAVQACSCLFPELSTPAGLHHCGPACMVHVWLHALSWHPDVPGYVLVLTLVLLLDQDWHVGMQGPYFVWCQGAVYQARHAARGPLAHERSGFATAGRLWQGRSVCTCQCDLASQYYTASKRVADRVPRRS